MITRKTNKLSAIAAALLWAAAACSNNPVVDELISKLLVDKTTIEAAAESGSYTVAVTANVPWTAASNAEWCTVSPVSGDGDATLTVAVTANTDSTARTATLIVAAKGMEAKMVAVTQAAKGAPFLKISLSDIAAAAGDSTYTVTVESNRAWTAASNAEWCTISPASNDGNGTLTVAVTANLDTLVRTATLIVATSGVEAKTVTVTQATKGAPFLKISLSDIAAAAGDSTYTVTVESNRAWTAASNAEWCTVSPASNDGNATLTVAVTANLDTLVRTATVTVRASGVEAETITVMQAGAFLNISLSGIAAIADDSTYTVTVTSNMAWTAASNAEWCTVSPTSGSGNGTLTVTVASNPTILSRTAILTMQMISGAETKKIIDVVQKISFRWELTDGTLTISGQCPMPDYGSSDNAAPWYAQRSDITSVIINDGITSIGERAFRDCYGLTSVTIPNSVIDIEYSAFYYCSGLTSVTIPNSVTSIGDYAFCGCSGLTSVTIPNSVTSIGQSAFAACSVTSVTIPNSVTSIGVWAFSSCISLTSVTIPNSVTSIGVWAFSDCENLTSINVDGGNPNYTSEDGVLFNKNKSTLLQYPGGKSGSYTIPNSVTSIGEWAFSSCISLTSVIIPNSVTSIGRSAFSSCYGLTSVTIPNSVTSIGRSAFFACYYLSAVHVGWSDPWAVNLSSQDAFYLIKSNAKLYVPNAALAAYKNCQQWTNYFNVENIVGE